MMKFKDIFDFFKWYSVLLLLIIFGWYEQRSLYFMPSQIIDSQMRQQQEEKLRC